MERINKTIDFNDGGKYVGQVADYKFDGEGTYFYPNGDVYKGNWYKGFETV